MAICPKCGSHLAKYELRSAGTKSTTKYYRNGIRNSFFFSIGGRKYSSTRLHKTVGFCPECGYHWESEDGHSFFSKLFMRILLFLLYLAVFVFIGEILFPGSIDDYYITPDWYSAVSLLTSALLAFIPSAFGKFAKVVYKWLNISKQRRVDLTQSNTPALESPHEPQESVFATSSTPLKAQSQQSRQIYEKIEFNFPDFTGLSEEEIFPYAVEVVFRTHCASVSVLQRHLKIGYAKAARLIDEMEERGIVGPFQGTKSRDIFITKLQWDEYKKWHNL